MAWIYTLLFTGRAAMLHMGVFTATIMTANVAAIIIPNQTIVVADLKAGRVPDAKYGKIAKQRSPAQQLPDAAGDLLHAVEPLSAGLRDAVELAHRLADLPRGRASSGTGSTRAMRARATRTWTWPAAVIIFILIAWLSTAPKLGDRRRGRWRRRRRSGFSHARRISPPRAT